MRIRTGRPRSHLATLVLLAGVTGCLEPTAEQSGRLLASYAGIASYPVTSLRFAAGPNDDISLDGAAFAANGVPYHAGPLSLPPRGTWPVRAALVAPSGDTLATASTVITLEPQHEVAIGLVAYPNLYSWFICNSIVARVPIPVQGRSPDTLYMFVSNEPISDLPPPVC